MLCNEGNWCGSIETYCPARYFGGTPMSRTAVIVSGVSTTTSVTSALNSDCAGARVVEVSRDMVIALAEPTMSLSVSRFREPDFLETGNWKLETGNWKLETGNLPRKPQIRIEQKDIANKPFEIVTGIGELPERPH